MKSRIFASLLLIIGIFSPYIEEAKAITTPFTITATTTFTPRHLYFMAASGCNDSNAGTSAGAPWCSLLSSNTHMSSLVCGDVIIAATGTYSSNNFQITNSPGTCPSVTDGIDGNGGVYAVVVLCAGNVGQCKITDTSNARSIQIGANYWSFQGWQVSTSGNNDGVAFATDCGSSTTFHHISFINDIADTTGAGYSFGTCGGTGSSDYYAVVGSIAQNANRHSACTSAFNFVVPKNFDTTSGTHIYADGNFGIANPGNAGCTSDGNGMILDSPDILSYTGQVVFRNNIVYSSREYGIHIFSQENTTVAPVVKVYNNTVYNSGTNPVGTVIGEITQYNDKFAQSTTSNIALTGAASRGGANLYAMIISNPNAAASSSGNLFKGTSATCDGSSCGGGSFPNSVAAFNSGTFGTNTYSDPSFNNTSDLLTNWVGTPSCTSFENVAQCMGYDAPTGTLTTNTVIYDLTATCGSCSGKGYQKPLMTCVSAASDPDFPTWMKGLIYLHWTGSIVQQRAGLANVPCGL